MAAILAATDSDGTRELQVCMSLVETHFIETHEARLKASSIKTHLFALKKFSDFLVLNQTTATFSESDSRKLQKQISLWNLSLSKDVKKEVVIKGSKDKGMIPP